MKKEYVFFLKKYIMCCKVKIMFIFAAEISIHPNEWKGSKLCWRNYKTYHQD